MTSSSILSSVLSCPSCLKGNGDRILSRDEPFNPKPNRVLLERERRSAIRKKRGPTMTDEFRHRLERILDASKGLSLASVAINFLREFPEFRRRPREQMMAFMEAAFSDLREEESAKERENGIASVDDFELFIAVMRPFAVKLGRDVTTEETMDMIRNLPERESEQQKALEIWDRWYSNKIFDPKTGRIFSSNHWRAEGTPRS